LILITGGARSGKSRMAERLASEAGGRVLCVATAEDSDTEMSARIAHHQARRPSEWGTLEVPCDVVPALREEEGGWDTLIVDCLTLWITNLLFAFSPGVHDAETLPEHDAEALPAERVEELAAYLAASWPQAIVVTNEVGSGIVPADPTARLFRDIQGRANQRFAAHADEVYLCVSGIPLRVKQRNSED